MIELKGLDLAARRQLAEVQQRHAALRALEGELRAVVSAAPVTPAAW